LGIRLDSGYRYLKEFMTYNLMCVEDFLINITQ